jgi:exodeoxyribonuclease-5
MNLSQYLDFVPTNDQANALKAISHFIKEENTEDFFVLLGYAGTGKTTITKAITSSLVDSNIDFSLNAPTGTAAKIIRNKTGQCAGTIHSRIYTVDKEHNGDGVNLLNRFNFNEEFTIFIVDEASMLSDWRNDDNSFMTPNSLMEDFVSFVKQGNKSNKVIFIGDDFQLTPFANGEQKNFSPALSKNYITKKFGWTGSMAKLEEVKRQAEDSIILNLASNIRNLKSFKTSREIGIPTLEHGRTKSYTQAINNYRSNFERGNLHNQIIINKSNNSVDWFNKVIRERLNLSSNLLSVNDFVVLQRNWMSNDGQLFLKGEMALVTAVSRPSDSYGGQQFVFADLEFIDLDGCVRKATSRILFDSLNTHHGILSKEKEQELVAHANKYNAKYRESKNIFDDEYLGAMRLRHAFAITCHKAQGGEWDNVFVEPSTSRNFDPRWLYTAVTRARQEVLTWAA